MRIVTIGDSLTAGTGPKENYQEYMKEELVAAGMRATIENHGIGGQVMFQIVSRLNWHLPAPLVVLMGGTNDVWHVSFARKPLERKIIDDILGSLARAINLAKKHDGTKLLVCTIPPFANLPAVPRSMHEIARVANGEIMDKCERNGIPCCDVNKAMQDELDPSFARVDLVVDDGVHFSRKGNRVCGKAIGRCCVGVLAGTTDATG